MLLQSIAEDPLRALRYMERYVNDGSPSGFTEENRPSAATDPFGFTPWFRPICIFSDDAPEVFGSVPQLLPFEEALGPNWFLIHPDMKSHADLTQFDHRLSENLRLVPTSSGRTAQILDIRAADYIKFHYDGLLGRIERHLTGKKAIAGPEVSSEIASSLNAGQLPLTLCILHESGAKLLTTKGPASKFPEWGLVWRETSPIGTRAKDIAYTIPFFALFSIDRLQSYHRTLFEALCTVWKRDAAQMLIEGILFPILDAYFSLIIKLGFQIELNAQNVLIGFSQEWRPVALIVRDLMGTEKDLSLRLHSGLPTEFRSSPYKCISKEAAQDLWTIRHSFVFDFKLGTYLLDLAVGAITGMDLIQQDDIVSLLRQHALTYITQLPADYFPRDLWYRHDRVLLDKVREYVSEPHPRYR
jgi:hypothetical protein